MRLPSLGVKGEPVATGVGAPIGGTRAVDTDEQHGLAAGGALGKVGHRSRLFPVVVGCVRVCGLEPGLIAGPAPDAVCVERR